MWDVKYNCDIKILVYIYEVAPEDPSPEIQKCTYVPNDLKRKTKNATPSEQFKN